MKIVDKVRRAKRQILRAKKSNTVENVPFLDDDHSDEKELKNYLNSLK